MPRGEEAAFRELSREASLAVLARNNVGRLAYSFRDRVEIVPLHYVLDGDWIYGRTAPGEKIDTLAHNWRVAFEVDEVNDTFDWCSVVVRGGFYVLGAEGGPQEREHGERALRAFRRFMPQAFTEADPVPFRTILFGVAIQDVTGRAARGFTRSSRSGSGSNR